MSATRPCWPERFLGVEPSGDTQTKFSKTDTYQTVTNSTNYSGMNIMLLWCRASEQMFTTPRWLTYKQAQELGSQVREVEQGQRPFFYKMLEKESGTREVEKISVLKSITVLTLYKLTAWQRALKSSRSR
jgi:antirestriction protein ArdC